MKFSHLALSIPTAERPGIGASILTSFAAKANAISLCKFTILLTLTLELVEFHIELLQDQF